MAEMIKQDEGSFVGETLNYAFHHPIKALGNTILIGYAVHCTREWGGPVFDKAMKKIETWRHDNGEEQIDQQIAE